MENSHYKYCTSKYCIRRWYKRRKRPLKLDLNVNEPCKNEKNEPWYRQRRDRFEKSGKI